MLTVGGIEKKFVFQKRFVFHLNDKFTVIFAKLNYFSPKTFLQIIFAKLYKIAM